MVVPTPEAYLSYLSNRYNIGIDDLKANGIKPIPCNCPSHICTGWRLCGIDEMTPKEIIDSLAKEEHF